MQILYVQQIYLKGDVRYWLGAYVKDLGEEPLIVNKSKDALKNKFQKVKDPNKSMAFYASLSTR